MNLRENAQRWNGRGHCKGGLFIFTHKMKKTARSVTFGSERVLYRSNTMVE